MLFSKKRFHENSLWSLIALLMAVSMLPTPFAVYINPVDKGPTWLGLDASATMAMNYALLKGWNWGHEIIYTYGPLSFLSTGIGFGIPRMLFVVSGIFLLFNFYFLFRDFILHSTHKPVAALIIFLLTLTTPLYFGAGLTWVLMIFLIYWMWRYHAHRGWLPLLMLPLLCTITFYIKLNTGLFIILFMLGFLLLLAIERRISRIGLLSSIGTLILLIAAGAWGLNVSLAVYIRGAFEVIKGYNDLMYLYQKHPESTNTIRWIFWGLSAFLILASMQQLRQKQFVATFILLTGFAYLFLLKKQSLFRNDQQHIQEFFSFAPFVLITGIAAFSFQGFPKLKAGISLFLILTCFTPVSSETPLGASLYERSSRRYSAPYRYLQEFKNYHPDQYLSHQSMRVLPERILQKVGSQTIDVFPWDVNYLLQNRLNYCPRPCFQTFQANSEYLQQINYHHYQTDGPNFVLYDYDAIDDAYPFNDAAILNLFLSRNYTAADSFMGNERWRLLLQRKRNIQPVPLQSTGKKIAGLNQEFPVNHSGFLRLQVHYSLMGRIHAFWDKPSPLLISYQRENGEWLTYKSSTELLKSGIYVGRLIRTNQDFERFMQNDTASLERIRGIRITGDHRHYQDQIIVEDFNISNQNF